MRSSIDSSQIFVSPVTNSIYQPLMTGTQGTVLPTGDSTQRSPTPSPATLRGNTSSGVNNITIEYFNGTTWQTLGSGTLPANGQQKQVLQSDGIGGALWGAYIKLDLGKYNVSLGDATVLPASSTGSYISAFGYSALANNTTGMSNTAVGCQALLANTSGLSNVAVGTGAGLATTTGYQNTAVGCHALDGNVSGFCNTAVGTNSGTSSNNLSNTIALGFGAQVSASNSIVIGNGNCNLGIGGGSTPLTAPQYGIHLGAASTGTTNFNPSVYFTGMTTDPVTPASNNDVVIYSKNGQLCYKTSNGSVNSFSSATIGIFTPILYFQNINITTYFQNTGQYTKIGNVVYYSIIIYLNNAPIPAGTDNMAGIKGLPFTAGPGRYMSAVCYGQMNINPTPLFLEVTPSSNLGCFRRVNSTAGGAFLNVVGNDFGVNAYLAITGMYFTA